MESNNVKLRLGPMIAIAVAGVVGVVLFKSCSTTTAPPANEHTSPTTTSAHASSTIPATGIILADGESADPHERVMSFVPITGGKPRARAPIDPFPRVPKTRSGLPLENDYYVAESVQEQRWLDRNGYPNTRQVAAYSAAPDIVLEQAAAHGDSVAEVMLAGRRLAQGDPTAAGKLMTAGMNGSSYALSTLASYLAGAENGNPELGYAISRVVELRGDWRSAITREVMFRTPLTSVQRVRAEGQAIHMLDDFRKHSPQGQRYIDPRPLRPLRNTDGP